jgi:hypothetical protein
MCKKCGKNGSVVVLCAHRSSTVPMSVPHVLGCVAKKMWPINTEGNKWAITIIVFSDMWLLQVVRTWNVFWQMKLISWVFCSGVYIIHNVHTVFIPSRQLHRTSGFFNSTWGSKKKHRKVRLQVTLDTMADPKIEEILAPLRASVKELVCFCLPSDCIFLN